MYSSYHIDNISLDDEDFNFIIYDVDHSISLLFGPSVGVINALIEMNNFMGNHS